MDCGSCLTCQNAWLQEGALSGMRENPRINRYLMQTRSLVASACHWILRRKPLQHDASSTTATTADTVAGSSPVADGVAIIATFAVLLLLLESEIESSNSKLKKAMTAKIKPQDHDELFMTGLLMRHVLHDLFYQKPKNGNLVIYCKPKTQDITVYTESCRILGCCEGT